MAAYTLRSNLEWLDYPDCVGLSEHGKCRYLNVSACIGEKCSFYKSKESEEKDIAIWHQRLRTYDEERQKHIAKKYYHGRRPWLEDEQS